MKDPQHSHLKYSIIQHIRTQEPLNEVSNVKSTDTIPETLLNADQSFLSLKKTRNSYFCAIPQNQALQESLFLK